MPESSTVLAARAAAALAICGTVLIACAAPHPAPDPSPEPVYALGVAAGDCPPDIAFYHAVAPHSIELGVVSTPTQVVSYSITSRDSAYDGLTGSAFVGEGANGHTFRIEVPMSAIELITVTATGAGRERPSVCAAVRL
ncbi:hypothetical protein [Mycolicibacterium arenosum]|uniref:Lipoprotein n=1 Tax=Mycolicibacterium arenosum TaxID=2952157 RepID=A0ABT1MD29_9MYCO|nr:hypothetical protein [Mycolicibacterium sp. CAU 1645]MCP9276465.1 hypothetical protein [Mycolicibacterium sp. CAU 1645]